MRYHTPTSRRKLKNAAAAQPESIFVGIVTWYRVERGEPIGVSLEQGSLRLYYKATTRHLTLGNWNNSSRLAAHRFTLRRCVVLKPVTRVQFYGTFDRSEGERYQCMEKNRRGARHGLFGVPPLSQKNVTAVRARVSRLKRGDQCVAGRKIVDKELTVRGERERDRNSERKRWDGTSREKNVVRHKHARTRARVCVHVPL